MVKKHEVNVTDNLGAILKRERVAADLTREEVAERVGVGVRHVAAIENEKRMPSAEILCRLVRAIGISADLVAYPEIALSEPDDAQLIRLIHICDKKVRRAVKAMLEVLCYSKTSEDNE